LDSISNFWEITFLYATLLYAILRDRLMGPLYAKQFLAGLKFPNIRLFLI